MRKFSDPTIKKVEADSLIYFDLFPLLRGLEGVRPGIKDRVKKIQQISNIRN